MTNDPTRPAFNVDNNDHPLSLSSDMNVQKAIRQLTPNDPAYVANPPPIQRLVSAIEHVLRGQEDRLRKQVSSDLRNVEARARSSPSTLVMNLGVIPNVADRARAIELLARLDHAIHALLDPGVDDWQAQIMRGLIIPSVDELKLLLDADGTSTEDVTQKRGRGLSLVGSLLSWARGLAIAIGALGSVDDAAATLKQTPRKVEELIDACGNAEWLWELLLGLYHTSKI